jgi:hypothetical protein
MRINDLNADEFMQSMALIGEALENIVNGKIGTDIKADISAYRAKANSEDSAESKKADAEAWAVDMLARYIPRVMRESVEDVYKLLAACEGQTLEEYKADFSPKKMMCDIKELTEAFNEDGELRELISPFLG